MIKLKLQETYKNQIITRCEDECILLCHAICFYTISSDINNLITDEIEIDILNKVTNFNRMIYD